MHSMSERAMAWPSHLSTLQPPDRLSGQSGQWCGARLNVLIGIHPDTLYSPLEREVFEHVGLDGHWFIAGLVDYLSRGYIDLSASPEEVEVDLYAFEEEVLPDLLVEMFMGAVPDDADEGHIRFLDEFLEENGMTILLLAKTAIHPLLEILSDLQPPPHVRSPNILEYLEGYSLVDSHTGALHFSF